MRISSVFFFFFWCILIYLNLEKQQSNQAIINSLFIRGLHVCLLHMDEPQGHTVPLKRQLLKVIELSVLSRHLSSFPFGPVLPPPCT